MIHHQDDWLTVYQGDCRDVLPTLPDASVNCVVTSPPYWGLRDYGADGQLGLEATPEQYVANLVAVFREVRRVLRDDGTVWLNLGDSYIASPGSGQARGESTFSPKHGTYVASDEGRGGKGWRGLPAKNLVGIPWRVAFALQADGWWLRSDIIWSKPNPMPESVTDRPTKAHEYLFLLSKRERYYYDQEAVREPDKGTDHSRIKLTPPEPSGGLLKPHMGIRYPEGRNGFGANLRSVWTIATRPYPGAHFAVFPPELPERCIKAGTSERGVCPECGAPWERVVEKSEPPTATYPSGDRAYRMAQATERGTLSGGDGRTGSPPGIHGYAVTSTTIGWQSTCVIGRPSDYHLEVEPVPAVVLDPFAGSGTVGLVANRLSRRAILIDLNPAYISQQMKRNAQLPAGLTA